MKHRLSIAARLFALILLVGSRASAAVERFAVIVGNNAGRPSEATLRYAEEDADRIARVLREVGGFAAEDTVLMRGASAAQVERALITTNDRIRALARPGTQVMLFVYFSGHADGSTIHLAGSELELELFERLVRSSAAHFRVLVLDACRSGALTRVKGGKPGPAFLAELTPQLGSEGAVFLTSSTWTEDAQESDELRGSFFTHYLRSALLGAGDEDGDGRVTLEEAYRYAFRWTLSATSRTWAGVQHPTFKYDVRGQGEIVITEPRAHGQSRATLTFPGRRGYLVFEADSGGPVVGEVADASRARSLSLKPGRYFVRGRAPDHLLEGELAVAAGQLLTVGDELLERVEYARLVRKGGVLESMRGVDVAYMFHTALENSSELCHGAFAGYRVTLTAFDLGLRLEGCSGGYANRDVTATSRELAANARLVIARDLAFLTVNGGLTGGAALLHQSFETRGVAPPRTTWAGHLGLTLGLSLDLTHGFELFAEEAFRTYISSFDGSVQPSSAFQQAVGLGKLW